MWGLGQLGLRLSLFARQLYGHIVSGADPD